MSIATNSNSSQQSFLQWISSHGFVIFLLVYGLWVFAPFLAPVLMHIGWTGTGKAIYFIYSFFCHQLPERSFFLFGEKTMYSLTEIQMTWQDTANPVLLRQFIGNAAIGWKIAWSDRMIWFYMSIWLFALLWFPIRRRIKPLVLWGFVLLLLPLILDGGTHAISDLAGIGNGFRDTNMWLAALTDYSLPKSFYAGDALGSFNSIMRFVTGVLAGLGISWLTFPYLFQIHFQNEQVVSVKYAKVINQIKRKDSYRSGG